MFDHRSYELCFRGGPAQYRGERIAAQRPRRNLGRQTLSGIFPLSLRLLDYIPLSNCIGAQLFMLQSCLLNAISIEGPRGQSLKSFQKTTCGGSWRAARPDRTWKLCAPSLIPFPMHLFISTLCNIVHNKAISWSSVSCFNKFIKPKEGVVEIPTYRQLVRSTS